MNKIFNNSLNDIKVGIVVPVYNARKTLKACVKSLINQTHENISIVLVDDGSTDGSSKLCDELSCLDERITVIHQENKGSTVARNTGFSSEWVRSSKYTMTCDADDTFTKEAVKEMVLLAEKNGADIVCGKYRRVWKNIALPIKEYQRPCFNIEEAKVYENQDIIEKLYVGCFGISDFPVCLCSKLYKTELMMKVVNNKPIVKFMGEDLSVMLNLIPLTKKIVIYPEYIYNYRIGGGTSKHMPYMMNDFLALYKEKKSLINIFSVPQDVQLLIDIEVINIVRDWLKRCVVLGKYTSEELHNEIVSLCDLHEIKTAANNVMNKTVKQEFVSAICNQDYDTLSQVVTKDMNKEKIKVMIKNIILKFS